MLTSPPHNREEVIPAENSGALRDGDIYENRSRRVRLFFVCESSDKGLSGATRKLSTNGLQRDIAEPDFGGVLAASFLESATLQAGLDLQNPIREFFLKRSCLHMH
jgi:hypothetical protein